MHSLKNSEVVGSYYDIVTKITISTLEVTVRALLVLMILCNFTVLKVERELRISWFTYLCYYRDFNYKTQMGAQFFKLLSTL